MSKGQRLQQRPVLNPCHEKYSFEWFVPGLGGGGGREDSNIKKVGVLVVSLRGVDKKITNIFSLHGLS